MTPEQIAAELEKRALQARIVDADPKFADGARWMLQLILTTLRDPDFVPEQQDVAV